MIKFSSGKVLLLQKLITQETGGSAGVRDFNLLDSALESAFQTFDGKELYPSKQEKAARIAYGLVTNHAFVDGNKRVGLYVMATFLEVNGLCLNVSESEFVRVGLELAAGSMKYDSLLKWIRENTNQ